MPILKEWEELTPKTQKQILKGSVASAITMGLSLGHHIFIYDFVPHQIDVRRETENGYIVGAPNNECWLVTNTHQSKMHPTLQVSRIED